MPVTIEKVNYAGLSITPEISIPVIILDISGRASDPEEFRLFVNDQVYPAIQNCVTSFAFYFNYLSGPYPQMFNPRITEMYEPQVSSWGGRVDGIGSIDGFQLLRSGQVNNAEIIPGSGVTIPVVSRFQIEIRYKNERVFGSYAYTGYGQPELLPVVLYRDSSTGKLITFPENNPSNTGPYLAGLNEWYNAAGGNGAAPVFAVPPDLSTINIGSPTGGMNPEPDDKKIEPDDITNEREAGPAPDPYWNAPTSDTDAPVGTFDYGGNPPGGSDDYNFPSISAVDAGFITLFNPSTAELKSLSRYLWSNSFDLNMFKKIFNDPMDLFLGLSILPVPIPNGGRKNVGIGLIDTGISMTLAASQWTEIDCGSVKIPNFTGAYLDYDPYTQIEIYLPFVGVRTLKADEIVGKTVKVSYKIDILSGACVAWIDVNGSVMYMFMGQCATSIPVASGDWTNIINGVLTVVGSAAVGAIKGGGTGAIAGGVSAVSSIAVGDGKISVERSGTISSAGGMLAAKKPFIVISSPRVCIPANQSYYEGYPAYVTKKLKSLKGFTQCELIHVSGIAGTEAELTELKALLLEGVIL